MATKKHEIDFSFPSPIDNQYLIGHDDILTKFTTAWNNREIHPIHPVWMLCGPNGIGKATLAYKIAKMVYGNIGDLFIVNTENNIDQDKKPKPDSKTISVHTVRQLIDKLQRTSMSGEWRTIIIDSVDELTKSASNALLKLLEEPPAKTLFLLVTHNLVNVLPTIRSRSRIEKLQPLTIENLKKICSVFLPDEEINQDILKLSNGSFGKIAYLKTFGGDKIYENLIQLLQDKRTTYTQLMNIANKIAESPQLYTIILDIAAYFNLAELYSKLTKSLNSIKKLNIKNPVAIFNLITEIQKCL